MEVKKFCTFEEQLQKIKEKGFIISNEEECLNFLKKVNYYNISGYFHYLNSKEITNVNFETIIMINEFDRKVRNLVFYVIEEIEQYLRTQISYFHAREYGAIGYLDEENFSDKHHNHKKFLGIINTHKLKNSKNHIIIHHNKKYNGNIPIWAIIEFFTIGELAHFYKDLKTQDKKNFLNETLGSKKYFKYFDSWLKCLTDIRNRCAHYSRLYFFNFYNTPKIPKNIKINNTYKLFEQILALKLIFNNNKKFKKIFIYPLQLLITKFLDYIDLKDIGFPDNWFEILIEYT